MNLCMVDLCLLASRYGATVAPRHGRVSNGSVFSVTAEFPFHCLPIVCSQTHHPSAAQDSRRAKVRQDAPLTVETISSLHDPWAQAPVMGVAMASPVPAQRPAPPPKASGHAHLHAISHKCAGSYDSSMRRWAPESLWPAPASMGPVIFFSI